MIFKVTYQPNDKFTPLRENTESLYIEANSVQEVRQRIADNTPYIVEYIEELSPAHLEYEQERNPDYKIVDF